MGISLLLNSVDEATLLSFKRDPTLAKKYLHLPYSDYLEYWQSYHSLPEDQKKDKCDLDSSWDPLFYLLNGKGSSNMGESIVYMEQKTKFYSVSWRGKRLEISYGKRSSKGTKDTKYLTSVEEAEDDAIAKIEAKVMKGYKIVMEFDPKIKKEAEQEKEVQEPDTEGSKKRKGRSSTGSSKKVKPENNLSDITMDRMSEEIIARNKVPKDNKVERLVQLARIIQDERNNSPLTYFLLGGEELKIEFAYGPPRILTPSQVKELNDSLSVLNENDIKKNYNPTKMDAEAIGPPNSYQNPDETWKYLVLHFNSLKEFVAKTVEENKGMITYLS